VPGVNDDPVHLDAVARLWAAGGIEAVDVMPYHAFGRDKHRRLGQRSALDRASATPEQVEGWLAALAARGCPARLDR
jgi:pyruvate-formate lyase-activating enzyme